MELDKAGRGSECDQGGGWLPEYRVLACVCVRQNMPGQVKKSLQKELHNKLMENFLLCFRFSGFHGVPHCRHSYFLLLVARASASARWPTVIDSRDHELKNLTVLGLRTSVTEFRARPWGEPSKRTTEVP